jgi:prevent-host-death family protein
MPGSSLGVRDAKTYTMRDLTQRTAQVIDEINETGRSAVVTKRGRFVALIVPLEHAQVERLTLSGPLAEELRARAVEAERPGAETYSSDQVAELLQNYHTE